MIKIKDQSDGTFHAEFGDLVLFVRNADLGTECTYGRLIQLDGNGNQVSNVWIEAEAVHDLAAAFQRLSELVRSADEKRPGADLDTQRLALEVLQNVRDEARSQLLSDNLSDGQVSNSLQRKLDRIAMMTAVALDALAKPQASTRKLECPTCDGNCKDPRNGAFACPTCHGAGAITVKL